MRRPISPSAVRVAGAYGAALALFVAGALLVPGYTSAFSVRAILVIAALLAVASLGQTLVVLLGGIDLSIPFVISFANVIGALLYGQGMPFPLVCLIVGGLALLIGGFNGAVSKGLGIQPLIVTLGTGMMVKGMVLVWTKGFPAGSAPEAVGDFVSLGGSFGPLPVPAVVPAVILLAVAAGLMLDRTPYGRQLYALGSNPGAAPYALIPPLRIWTVTYALSALFAAVTGILLLGFTGSAYGDAGDPYLFQTIAAVVVGGAALVGGQGSFWGTIAGALVLTQINTLLIGFGFRPAAVQTAIGLLILLLVAVYGRDRHVRTTI